MSVLGGRRRRPGPTVRTRVREFRGEDERRHEDRLATEEPLEIRLAWPGTPARRVWVTMRTPGHDFELAAGWLVHEGISTGLPSLIDVPDSPGSPGSPGVPAGAIAGVAYCTDVDLAPEQEFNVVTATLAGAPATDPGHRHVAQSAGSSACGVCGKDSIAAALTVATGSRWAGGPPAPSVVRRLPDRLREHQSVFARTGGVHAAGLFTADGEALVVREDVGRHNAVDKVTGARVLGGASPADACLVVSGRAGFELVQKAVTSGVASLAAVGAPTSLAVHLAEQAGLTLFGFTSRDRVVQYS